jgi:hypothetical protein
MATTNWIVPSDFDLAKIVSEAVLQRANENTDDASLQQTAAMAWAQNDPSYRAAYDPTLEDRIADQLNLAILQFRGAIQNAGKQPLSLTPFSVPPDACYKHCITIAAYGVISSTLNLQWVISTEKGDSSPITALFRLANKYLEEVSKGKVVVPPNDPTGRDYLTAINVPWFSSCPSPYGVYDSTKPINPPVEPVRFGANNRPVDLRTYDGYFNEGMSAPYWWPAGEIGQP